MASHMGSIHDLIQCPYVPAHMVGSSKFQSHLVKCRKSNPELAKEISICSFNQVHHIRTEDMGYHMMVCKDRLTQQLHGLSLANLCVNDWRAHEYPDHPTPSLSARCARDFSDDDDALSEYPESEHESDYTSDGTSDATSYRTSNATSDTTSCYEKSQGEDEDSDTETEQEVEVATKSEAEQAYDESWNIPDVLK